MHPELTTESRNPASNGLDQMSTIELVRLINREDAGVAVAVATQERQIAQAIELISARLKVGGRLVYVGAGTSGRLGVLDASECPPTFNAKPEQVVGLIAGGYRALQQSVEGAEDSSDLAREDLNGIGLSARDVVVGIAASGRTPYVLAALQYARSMDAATIGFTCNQGSDLVAHAEIIIAVVVGPEVLSGSTRMKAGTATKMVLNMLTTGAMVRLGKTYGNLMVDLQATNEKLVQRTLGILHQLTGLEEDAARKLLAACAGELKTAIICQRLRLQPNAGRARLAAAHGNLREALDGNE